MTYRDGPGMERAFAFVMEVGKMLDEKEEWDMDDNFNTTEGLHAVYQEIMMGRR